MMSTPLLLSSIKIGKRTAFNRFAILPMEANDADDKGRPSELTIKRYKGYAEGKAGVIFVESLGLDETCISRRNQLLIINNNIEGLRQLVLEMKTINPHAIVLFQLAHSGRFADPEFSERTGVYELPNDRGVRVLTPIELETLGEKYVQAAVIAKEAGADGIDFKHCHGFICGELLRPANTRSDKYGGSFENRTRFFRDTYTAMREAVGSEFIIGVRISAYEGVPGGFGTSGPDEVIEDMTEVVDFVKLMEQEGVDFISTSAGEMSAAIDIMIPSDVYPQGIYRHFGWTRSIKDTVSIPVIGAGYSYLREGKTSLGVAIGGEKSLLYYGEKNIKDGVTDIIGLGRQSFADPYFVKKFIDGKAGTIKYCISCGGCGTLLGAQKRVGCTIYNSDYRKLLKTVE